MADRHEKSREIALKRFPGILFCGPVGIQTQDLQNRKLSGGFANPLCVNWLCFRFYLGVNQGETSCPFIAPARGRACGCRLSPGARTSMAIFPAWGKCPSGFSPAFRQASFALSVTSQNLSHLAWPSWVASSLALRHSTPSHLFAVDSSRRNSSVIPSASMFLSLHSTLQR